MWAQQTQQQLGLLLPHRQQRCTRTGWQPLLLLLLLDLQLMLMPPASSHQAAVTAAHVLPLDHSR